MSGLCPVRVRVRVWFVSGWCLGSCPVRVRVSVWVRVRIVSLSCLVRVRFVSGSYPVWNYFVFVLCLFDDWVRDYFISISYLVSYTIRN